MYSRSTSLSFFEKAIEELQTSKLIASTTKMPPGNSNNKPTVVERCSYCGSPSCSGERNHTIRHVNPMNYGQPPIFHADSQTRSIAGTGRYVYGSADSVSKTTAAPKPAVLPSNQLSSTSSNIGSSKTDGSAYTGCLARSSPAPRPSAIAPGQLSRPAGLNKTAGSTIANAVIEKGAVSYSQSSRTGSEVVSFKTDGSTNPSSINEKPPASPLVVTPSNQLSSTSGSVESSKTNVLTTYCYIDAKPSVSPSSQVEGGSSSMTSNKSPGFTPVIGINTTLVAPKPLISLQKSSQMSSSDIVSASKDVSNISTTKVLHKNITDVKQESISSYESSKVDLHGSIDRNCATALQGESEYQLSTGNDLDSQDFLKKHSKRASVFEGAVIRILGSRMAEVRINDPDGGLKLAQLFVEKLSLHRNAPTYAASVDIRSVLRVGDCIKLVCTEHKKKDSGFHYFAHQAWKTEEDSALNNNWVNNDAESVNSFASYSSLHDSEKQLGKSAARRRRRGKVTNEQTSNVLGVDISKWLDNSSHLGSNLAQSEALIEGCEYTGKVVKLRLPFAFVVEVELKKGPQCIFVYSKYFYPEGPNSSAMTQGLPIRGVVSIGDVIIVIPIRSNQQKTNEFEWVARKAWPNGKESAASEINKNILEKVPKNYVEPFQSKNSDFVWVKSDQDGVILSLQTDWGLVGDLKNEHVFVFTRKHSYLFGLSLKSFFLEDVLMEGDLVKYSQEEGERGEMNANLLYYGCPLPDFNSFVKAINEYCESRNIKDSIETELTLQGEAMYSFK
ncbi:hypothetical protein J437_LFUL001526 [Ladona fulva]|uniref:Uncharacterized protein n=1 Tax=Ladona fulva TaxID=123851 RepID=A0A8K0NSP3_LADFU|nr:hypothetical protein J437_LFUL001526 [Ladona fulva]